MNWFLENENCGPFKCETVIQADPDANVANGDKYIALKTYTKEIILLSMRIFGIHGGIMGWFIISTKLIVTKKF